MIQNYFTISADNFNILTRQRNNVYLPQAYLTIFQKGAYYNSGITIFKSRPTEIKDLQIFPRNLKFHLNIFLYSHSFYPLDEYFNR
jgi:hypothetical protein